MARHRSVAPTVVGLLALTALVAAPSRGPVSGAPIVAFAPRFVTNTNGIIRTIGNNVLTCPPSDQCRNAQTRGGNGPSASNNHYSMVNLDVDGPDYPQTFNSSSAELTLPAGRGSVLFAGLYWGARRANSSGSLTPNPIDRMLLRLPGESEYRTVTSDQTFGPTTTPDRAYQQFADVTSLVNTAGAGEYWGANVAAGVGFDRYGGWSLVVVARDPTMPLRNLTVFDGFSAIEANSGDTITISGFVAPLLGTVDARLGMVAYEGDRGGTGDQAFLNNTRLGTAVSSGSNFFNGSNELDGRIVTARQPAHANMLGFDIKKFGVPGTIPNGARSARVQLSTLSERYSIGVLATAINLNAPDFTTSRKAATNLTGPDPASAGDVIEYTITETNSGPTAATNTVLTDPLPPNTTFVPGSLQVVTGPNANPKTDAADGDQAEYDSASRTVRFRLGTGASGTAGGTITAGASTSVRFRVVVGQGAPGTTLVNRASLVFVAASIGGEPLTHVSNDATTPVEVSADLSITKSTAPDPAVSGADVTSTIVVTNNGPNTAAAVALTDAVDPGVVPTDVTPAASCTLAGQNVTCALGDLAAGASRTITVTGRAPPDSTISTSSNTARVSSTTADPDPADNSAVTTVAVVARADLAITKQASPPTVTPGSTVTFPITVTNNGPSTAVGAQVVDVLDPRLTQITVAPPCALQDSRVSCSFGDLAPGATRSATITAVLRAGVAADTPIDNTASVSSRTPDPTAANDQATATLQAGEPSANLTITREVVATPLVAGGRGAQLTLRVTNNGPSDATGVELSGPVPAGLTVTAVSTSRGSCVFGAEVVCTVGGLPVGSTAVITVDVIAQPAAPEGPQATTATVRANQSDPVAGDNQATTNLTVATSADLAVVKSGSPQLTPGGSSFYQIEVVNRGPSAAEAVTLQDPLPEGVIDVEVLPAGTCAPLVAGSPLTCQLGDIPALGSAAVRINYTVDPDFSGDELVNTATASSPTPDENTTNNSSAFTSNTTPQADLVLAKRVLTSPAIAGAPISWELQATNNGPSTATAVAITDTLPPGLGAIVVSPGCTVAGDTVTCIAGTVEPNEQTPAFSVSATIPLEPAGTSVTNDAEVSSSTPDPSPASNVRSATVPIETRADVRVTKAAVPRALPAGAGLPTFEITVTNDGPSIARDVELTDLLPFAAIIETVTPDPACTFSGIDVECTLGDLAPGESTDIVITYFTRSSVTPRVYINEATATAATVDPDPSDNTGTAEAEVLPPSVDVTVAKTGSAEVVAGGTFDYRVEVQNGGPSTAFDVVVTDELPEGFTPEVATAEFGSCTISGRTVTCQLPFVYEPPFEEFNAPILISGTVSPDAGDSVVNTATAVAIEPDSDTSNNTGSTSTSIRHESAVTMTKEVGTPELVAGGLAAYTVTVTNAGPSAAAGAVVTDLLPDGATFVPDGSDSRCAPDTAGDVVCPLGTVEPLETVQLRINGRVDPGSMAPELTNAAVFTSTSTDPEPGDNTATIITPVRRSADLLATKTAITEASTAGTEAAFNVTVTNEGPSTARQVDLRETIPDGTTLVSIETTPSVPCIDTVCALGDILPGESVSAVVTVAIPPSHPAGTITNVVTADSPTPAPNPGRRQATASAEVILEADVTVVKTLATDPVVAGMPVTYDIVVTNDGPSDAVNLTFVDPFPPGTTFVSGSVPPAAECEVSTIDIPTASCILPLLPAGESVSGQVVLDTSPDLRGTITNGALVGSEALDRADSGNLSFASAPVVAVDREVDLAVTKAGPAELLAGGPFEYTVTVANEGVSVSTGTTARDVLPAGLTPTAATVDGSPCSISGREVTCQIGRLDPGGPPVTVTISGTVSPAITGTSVTNTVTATPAGTETDPADNTATTTAAITREADLRITKAAQAAPFAAGGTGRWTLTVANDGPSAASAVVVTDSWPDGVTFDAAITDDRCTLGPPDVVSCDVGALDIGATTTLSVGGTLDPDLTVDSPITNSAAVTSPTPDPVPTDNEVDATAGVTHVSDVSVDVVADQEEVTAGAPASFTVSISNEGPSVADDVVLTKQLPPEFDDVVSMAAIPSGCTGNELTVTCPLGDLPANATVTLHFSGRVAVGTAPGTALIGRATVRTGAADPLTANNRDSDTITVVAAGGVTTTTVSTTTSTVATTAVTTTTVNQGAGGGGGGGGGSLPVVGAAVLGIVAAATLLVMAGGGLRLVASTSRRRRSTGS